MGGQTMIYYIMPGHIFTIFLSLAHMTSVTFPAKITDYAGGRKGDFLVYGLNKDKTLVFESKGVNFKHNFIAFGGGEKYHFNLAYDEGKSNKDIEIKKGVPCMAFVLLKETPSWRLFECPKSLYFVNKKSTPVKVNDQMVAKKSYLSKGPPIVVEGRLIYYQGVLQ